MGKEKKLAAREREREEEASRQNFVIANFKYFATGFVILAMTMGSFTMYQGYRDVGTLSYIALDDTEAVKDALFSSTPRLVVCSYDGGGNALTSPLKAAAKRVRDEVPLNLIPCDQKLPSGKTVPERMKLDPKLPQVFVTGNADVWQFPKDTLGDVNKTVEYIHLAAKPRLKEVKTAKDLQKYCTQNAACVVVGFRHKLDKNIKSRVLKVYGSNRAARVVSIDTQKLQVKLPEELLASKPKENKNEKVFGLSMLDNKTYGRFVSTPSEKELTKLFADVLKKPPGLPLLSFAPAVEKREHKLAKKKEQGKKKPKKEEEEEEEEEAEEEDAKEEEESGTDDEDDDDFIPGWDDLLKAPNAEM